MSNGYLGADNRYVICDVCGKKFRVKETIQITDRYSSQNRMIVCKADADMVNPQSYPYTLPKEKTLSNPSYVRVPGSDTFVINSLSDRLPGIPRNLICTLDPLTNELTLIWDGPEDGGSSPILGYKILRSDFQSEPPELIATTIIPSTVYIDNSADYLIDYTYRVAAYSVVGTGPYSDYAYWPRDLNVTYLLCSQDSANLTTSSGDILIL